MAVFCQAGKKSGRNSQVALRRGFTVISITSVLKYNYSIQASIKQGSALARGQTPIRTLISS